MLYIIGSRAFKAFFPREKIECNDLDLIGTEKEFLAFINKRRAWGDIIGDIEWKGNYKITAQSQEYGLIECELIRKNNSSAKYVELIKDSANIFNTQMDGLDFVYMPPFIQYSIKLSHIYRPVNWEKHIKQFSVLTQFFYDIDLIPEITAIRTKETDEFFGKLKTPPVNKADKDTFFADNIEKIRVFEHDDIHKMVAYKKDIPAFTLIQKDPMKVATSKDLWDKLSYNKKCYCVLEEAFTIALERKIIPYLFIGKQYASEKESFEYALMRICTTLCSGWFREFALYNYDVLRKRGLQVDYVNKFLDRYENGDIVRIDTYKKFINDKK